MKLARCEAKQQPVALRQFQYYFLISDCIMSLLVATSIHPVRGKTNGKKSKRHDDIRIAMMRIIMLLSFSPGFTGLCCTATVCPCFLRDRLFLSSLILSPRPTFRLCMASISIYVPVFPSASRSIYLCINTSLSDTRQSNDWHAFHLYCSFFPRDKVQQSF